MDERINAAIGKVLELFKSGNVPEALAKVMFPYPNIPAEKWSLLNRTMVFLSGAMDARGFQQWKEAGRHVKKGSRAIHILAPRFKKIEEDDSRILTGFLAIPVFRAEDTEGEPLEYENIKLPEFPLLEVAQQWGITVKAIPGNYRYYGYYSQNRGEIALATPDEQTFFHELAHASHSRVKGGLEPGQDWRQEIVAEFTAAVLAEMVGRRTNHGYSYRYIESYAKEANITPAVACIRLIGEVEKVIKLIITCQEGEGERLSASMP